MRADFSPASVLFAASLASGCGWNQLPHQDNVTIDALWDAHNVVPTVDGLYVSLPSAGALALIGPEGETTRVDIGVGRVTRIEPAPDGQTVLAFLRRTRCTPEDPRDLKKIKSLDDCDALDRETETELALVTAGKVSSSHPLSGAYNQVAFTDDGRFAVAYLDFTQEIQVDAVLNLTGVVIVDLQAGETTVVPVGFAADRVLFVENDVGQATQAIVVSRNRVAALDLTVSPAEILVTFPLTLDPDTVVDPVGIELTPDGRYALLSAKGSSDLYALDLEQRAINIVELAGPPAAMAVNAGADRTAFVYPGRATVELLEHNFFEVEAIDLDEPMSEITVAGGQVVLWSTGSAHDLYRIDLANDDLVEYRLQNPATALYIAPTNEFAVVLTRPEGNFGGTGVDAFYDNHPGVEIVDLRTDDTEPLALPGQGLAVAFAGDADSLSALVLQEGIDYVYRLDLYTRQNEEIDLSAPPVAIGSMPDNRFFITHQSALGLISFLDPSTGDITEVAGFAATGIIDPTQLLNDEEAQ